METSAKTAMNVNEIFMAIGEQPLALLCFMLAAGFSIAYIHTKYRNDPILRLNVQINPLFSVHSQEAA